MAYDDLGRVSKIYYPEGFVAQNRYDQKGFLVEVDDGLKRVRYWKALEIDEFGHVTRDVMGNGVQTARLFDPATQRLSSERAVGPGNVRILALRLSYDKAGNLLRRAENVQGRDEAFDYDQINRLTGFEPRGASAETYAYDAAGRIKFKTGLGTYSYGTATNGGDDKVPSVPAHGVIRITSNGKPRTFAYDSHGNLTRDGPNTYFYASDNHLTSAVVDRDHWSSFSYGPKGNRYQQINHQGSSVLETVSVGAYQRITELGVIPYAGVPRLVRHRWYLMNGSGIFAVVESNSEYFYTSDFIFHHGALRILPHYPFDSSWTPGIANPLIGNAKSENSAGRGTTPRPAGTARR